MTFKSHGAPRSFKIHGNKRISRLHFLSGPMKPLHSAAAAAAGAHAVVVGGGGIRSSQGGRLFSSSSASSLSTISLKYNTTLKPKMDSPSSPPKTWHPSLGIVFAGESRNASCRPLMARNFTSQVAVVSSSSDTLGSLLETQAPPPPGTGNGGNHKPGGDSVNVTTTLADAQEARPEVKEEATQEPKEEAGDENAIPPYTPLEFKIPQDLFRKAKKAAKGTPESYWNYSLYRRPTEETDIPSKVKVHYCKSNHTTERVLKQYFAHEKILGFDLEWDPHAWKYAAAENKPGASASRAARRNVSVLQLASESRIGIFHLALFPKGESLVTPTMRKIMEDPEIIKLGVHIKGDTSRLQKYLKVQSRGTFELSHLYKLVKYSARGEYGEINRSLVSLANQVGDVLGLPLFKGEDVRTSDWTKQLTMEQIVYGASDAYAAVQIFAVLNHQREKLNPVPPLPAYAELNKPIRLGEGIVVPRKVPAAVPPAAEDCGDVLPPAEDEITDESGLSVKTIKPIVDGTITIEPEADPSSSSTTTAAAASATPKSPKSPRAARKLVGPSDPRVERAAEWADQYRLDHPECEVQIPALRCWHVWHHSPELDTAGVAALLRDPPLSTVTVAGYIVRAIKKEKFEFDRARLRDEVLVHVHKAILAKHYGVVVKMCDEEILTVGEVAESVGL